MAELIDLFDCNQKFTGEIIQRGDSIPSGRFFNVVHLCLFNQKMEMLCQKRADNKAGYPGYWDFTVGGCCISGENVYQSMQREFKEELGINYPFTEDNLLFVLQGDCFFDHYFLIIADLDVKKLTLQKEEVSDASYFSFDQISEMVEQGTFIPYEQLELIQQVITQLFDAAKQ